MHALILKLLALAALVLMPLGMQAASAAPAGHPPAAAAAGHCDEEGGQPAGHSSDPAIDCAMGCSMLAAGEARAADPAFSPSLPSGRPLAKRRSGLHPDTATPPPKLS